MSYSINNVNVNGVKALTNNVNVNVSNKMGGYGKAKQADYVADQLVENFNSPESRAFYCKVAYKLPENKIWGNVETAMKGHSPAKLFTWLCNKDMA